MLMLFAFNTFNTLAEEHVYREDVYVECYYQEEYVYLVSQIRCFTCLGCLPRTVICCLLSFKVCF